MNAEQSNPPISILGLQRYLTCHHLSKSKKSIKSSYSMWSHPLSQPWSLHLQQLLLDRQRMHSLLLPALKPADVTVGGQHKMCSHHTSDVESNASTRPIIDTRCTTRSKYWQSCRLSCSVLWVLHPIHLDSQSVPITSPCLNSSSRLNELGIFIMLVYISSVRLQALCRKYPKPFHLYHSFNFYFKGLEKKLDLESQQKMNL